MNKNKGFTAVEMMFVLAIGAAILMMTFLAISSANKSKRDAQRKADLARFEQGMSDWANENDGIYPNFSGGTPPGQTGTDWLAKYNVNSPEGNPYNITAAAVNAACSGPSTVYYERISDRSYKIKMCLEAGEVTEEHSL